MGSFRPFIGCEGGRAPGRSLAGAEPGACLTEGFRWPQPWPTSFPILHRLKAIGFPQAHPSRQKGTNMNATQTWVLAAILGTGGVAARAQRPDPAQMMSAQREAMAKLAFLDGEWRGPAWTLLPNGDKHAVTQTERVGPLLDGVIRLVEGRAYTADGKTGFNAFATISYDLAKKAYIMHSHAQGHVGDFVLNVRDDGFSWEIPAGPMTIRYTATVKDGVWTEVGDRVTAGKDPVRIFEMTVKRLGGSTWPGANPVGAK